MILEDLMMYKYLKGINSTLAEQVKDIYELTFETINSISRSFGNYTMHDMNHSLRVASYIEQLAFGIDKDAENKIKNFNALELSMMLLSSILHDIGMTIREKDRDLIKSEKIDKVSKSFSFKGVLKVNNNNEEEAIKEIIRRLHASRVYDFLDEDLGGTTIRNKLVINGNISYADDIAEICSLHGEEHASLINITTERTKGEFTYNPRYIAAMLRIADLLDIDKQRTPMLWYNIINVDGFSKEEWEKHFIIENTIKLKKYIDNKMQIYFDGRSSNAKIHRKYLKYIDELKKEIENTDELLNTKTAKDQYRFNVCSRIDDRVKTEGFTYSDLRLNLDYSSITNLLMGKNIYGNNKLGLRELIQNSIDACELMKESNNGISKYLSVKPEIYVLVNKKDNYVKIKDSGIGMTLDVIKKHFLNVGKSYYKSNDFLYKNCEYTPIGQYGIGFLACFLLSDNVTVRTKYYNDYEIHQIELEKNSEYVVTTSQQTPNFTGTEISLDYDKFFQVFENFDDLKDFLEEHFYTSIPITIYNEDDDTKFDIKNKFKESTKILTEEFPEDFFVIKCEDFSDNMEGKIIIKKDELNRYKSNEDLKSKKVFLFQKKENSLKMIEDFNLIDSKYFFYICYPNIPNNEFKKLNIDKSKKSKRKKIMMKYAKEHNELVNILIKMDELDAFFSNELLSFSENDDNISRTKNIFNNSNIPFYKLFFEEFHFFDIFERVFVYNQRIEFMNYIFFDSGRYYNPRNKSINLNTQYYNKGISIKGSRFFCGYSPYKFHNIFGYINNVSIPQKLDVSRNNIINGEDEITTEIYKIIIKAILASKSNKNEIELLNALLNS